MTCTFIEGLYPDYMHMVHLAVAVDLITSMLLEITDDASIFSQASRERRLLHVWEAYREWAEQLKVGDRAGKRLFTTGVLRNNKVVEVSQKILSATACRYMIMWAAAFMTSICQSLQPVPILIQWFACVIE